jgi:ApbE superfamily uncharacterized protein (UPF0280 family)
MPVSSDRNKYSRRLKIKQTNIYLQTDFEPSLEFADQSIRYNRAIIESYITENPEFLTSFSPVEISYNVPTIIKRMKRASLIAGTGPMASVAGAIADIAAEALCNGGGSYGIAENGGDISIIGNKSRSIVGIYAGSSSGGNNNGLKKFAFKLRQTDLPIGICTSAGNLGHSISLGEADAAIVIANSATIADSAATQLGNFIKKDDPEGSVQRTLEVADGIHEIKGCLIFIDNLVGRVGKLPEMVELEHYDEYEFY